MFAITSLDYYCCKTHMAKQLSLTFCCLLNYLLFSRLYLFIS